MESKGHFQYWTSTQTRASLKDLQVMAMRMWVASSGWKYTEKYLIEKIDFAMTDSTAYNLVAIQDVCAELKTESISESSICKCASYDDVSKKGQTSVARSSCCITNKDHQRLFHYWHRFPRWIIGMHSSNFFVFIYKQGLLIKTMEPLRTLQCLQKSDEKWVTFNERSLF